MQQISKTTSSLLSSPPPAAAAEDGPGDLPPHCEDRPASPAFSTSSTADEEGSSPILPPLTVPSLRARNEQSRRTPSHSPTASSHYYTASWGSPYQQPPASIRTHSHAHSLPASSETSEDSPIRHLEFHTPFLRPAPTFARFHSEPDFVTSDGLISAAVLANRARRPATGLTEDWIRQHTGGEAAEANNWLSDDPGESEHSSLSGSISGDARDWLGRDDNPRTPTLKTFLESREKTRVAKRGHRRHLTTETLKQEDFSDAAIPTMSLSNVDETLGVDVEVQVPTPETELPPPPPPKEWRAASLPVPTEPNPMPTPPRQKKKVPWKGKSILVLLPWDDERGKNGKVPMPMTKKDVAAMMKEWEQLGYDTTGFNLGHESSGLDEGSQGQSRSPWPLVQDTNSERVERNFRISIPDRREWDDYVQELREIKLRALGVSLGDEDPVPTISPAVSNISRRTSMQYPPLPFSPPLPTSSANSSHLTHQANPFSPALMPGAGGMSTSQSSNPGSIASPASMHAHMQGKYNPRQSVSFTGAEHPFGSPFQYAQNQSPGVWSPQQMLYQQGHARGGSPSLHNLSTMMSPASPFSQDGYFPQNGDVMSQMQQRQQILQNQLAHQQQLQLSARASPRLQEVREAEDEDQPSKSPSKTPEARQIKHNPSASLQKEIDDAEYHLEEQFQRQLEHEDYSPHSDKPEDTFEEAETTVHARNPSASKGLGASRFAGDDDSEEGPVLHHPQPHSRGHSLSQRPFHDSEESAPESKSGLLGAAGKPDLSDIETNPSNLGTPIPTMDLSSSGHGRALSAASNPWADSDANHTEDSTISKRPGHVSKPSMSKLNVAAKEFKFDPSNTFKPNQFAFGANSFQSQGINAYTAFAPPVSSSSSHFSNHSIASSKGRINVTAPVFTPGQSEFSFSTSGPSFRPDAPPFTPGAFTDSVGSGSEGPRTSIFGSIDLSALGISKPAKKNKAIPIIRPDSSQSRNLEDETMEGKDGRITQGEGRFKRAKGANNDGDSVPLFAESMPLGETTREQSPPKENLQAPVTQADKENSAPLDSGEEENPPVPAKSHSRDFSMNSPESGGKDFAPWEFSQQKQAEDFNAARPFTSKRYGSGLPAYGNYALSSDEPQTPVEPEKPKGHKKSMSSLSATAKPFEFRPGAFNFTFGEPSEPIPAPTPIAAPAPIAAVILPKTGGLAASRYASSPTPPPAAISEIPSPEVHLDRHESVQFQASLPGPESPPTYTEEEAEDQPERIHEQTVEEIDDILMHLNQAEQSAPAREADVPIWLQNSPPRQVQLPEPDHSSPIRLLPQNLMRSDAPSPSPRRFHPLPGQSGVFGRISEDPFIGESPPAQQFGSPVRQLNRVDSLPPSEWDDVLSETEEAKLQPRAQFFDNHVNELVGGILSERLDPLERTLENIQMSIDMMASRGPSSRRERRSISGALSDADDEDDDNPRRSLSPRRDNKMEKIRAIVTEVLNNHQPSRPQTATLSSDASDSRVMKVLEDMREQFGASMRLDLRGEDLRNIVEEAVERRMPATPKPYFDEAAAAREAEYRSRIADLEEKLLPAKPIVDEAAIAREAEYKARIADLEEKLLRAEGESSSRIADLEERLVRTEDQTEQEVRTRRAAEDRLAEVQRLLRISSEEEVRLREAMDEREIKIREIVDESDVKVRSVEEQRAKTTMRIALLEAAQDNAQRSQSELQNRINITEIDLRESRQETQRWQMEAERALEAARRHSDDAEQANETNKELRRTIDSLRTQIEESIRVREGMRGKLMDLQEDMAKAARDISEENARRAKKEAELVARQEVLDAKLQAEARTRERLETEIERLEAGEREGMRAVNDAKKLDLLLEDLRQENHAALKDAMRYKREFEEARESGLAEVQRTTHYMQGQIEAANNQVNVVREDLENQVSRVRAELDQVKLDSDTARAKHEMLLEEVENTKQSLVDEMKRKHADAIEDLETQHKRQLDNTLEDAERSAQHLLERLSLSSAKTEHLQDRVVHLEEKLEVANQAAAAAATAAKTARSTSTSVHGHHKAISRGMDLPEKISPQALRESIMVLQEQLQERESTIEQLEATLSTMDLDAPTKISKRDDEIMWLRELLAVRKGDLQDIVQSLSAEQFDAVRVRDAAIRLSANLEMEEQERERAMNGGSAITLPNIAASLRDVASSPRVAQAVGPLAAAWGNWRKSRSDLGQEMQPGHSRSSSSTPARASPSSQSFLSGLLTPPASTARQGTPPTTLRQSQGSEQQQPTAFGSTGQRMTMAQLANQPRTMPRQPVRGSPAKSRSSAGPSTPPMMRKSSYDADARAEDFSDAGFYDDDESTVEDYGARRDGKGVGGW